MISVKSTHIHTHTHIHTGNFKNNKIVPDLFELILSIISNEIMLCYIAKCILAIHIAKFYAP